ncbi:OprD family porin [Pseudomonas nicosulfuronedens]|uniref:OprD family porin n=1 Tax=Pseudomonas nicosulfuronedens TaxID=2571105 RepID=A0A5R9R9L3_9PSED|nr:OprD family porin [Pseudomonas nicosulfuronedens]MDH1007518.1 OprD family porin [Pseudomonas nicosulfuronedens]MDH1977564.1 OprD family porin [Pseudomonas nicosulfuronedens]MDH2025837.1 OprD family porin [Pseudomonas nicosulfuronedens]TLX79739.1 OprD family porin [Pseudomonas nicosulfuronedens]
MTAQPLAATAFAKPNSRCLTPALLAFAGVAPLCDAAGFIEDSSATLSTQNIYFNRDFRDGAGQSKREEWAQGFILDFQSGYTPGTIGVGLDAMGMLGLKLDSSPDRTGTGLLPTHDDGRAADEYSKLGLTAKFKASETELKVGSLIPDLPTLQPNDSRLFPQTFEGGLLNSTDLPGLNFTGGRLEKVKDRDSTDWQDLALNNKNRRFSGGSAEGKHYDLVGGDYKLTDHLTGRYHYAQLDEVYRQHFVGLLATYPLGPGKFSADVRLAISDDQGEARGGEIDNRAFNGMLAYTLGANKFSLGWQQMSGDSAFPYIDGSNPYLVNFVQVGDFAETDERSWQVRHDYDFAGLGLPGLTLMNRYISGDNAKINGMDGHGKEWERNTDIKYVIQSGPLKDVAVRVRNATYRSSFARDADETRIYLSYSLAIW